MADSSPLLISKITISGATLASILQRLSSSPGDLDGLLFGHFTPLPPPAPSDDLPSSSTPLSPSFSASITSFHSSGSPSSFYDSLGRIHPPSLLRASPHHRLPALLGWFSARRRTPLRPSMRELSVSNSLFQTLTLINPAATPPSLFLLISFSSTENQAIHTHEYRAFHFRPKTGLLEPRSLHVVNIGMDFRGQYGSFSPDSALPRMPLGAGDDDKLESAAAQVLLDSVAEGFRVERMGRLVGRGAEEYVLELEDLYRKMLEKLEGLARLVERSSEKVLEQVVCVF